MALDYPDVKLAETNMTEQHSSEPNTNLPGRRLVPQERLTFAKNLQKARKAVGLTQQELGQRTGLAQPFISELENGKTTVSVDNAAALAKAVSCPLHKLLKPIV